MSAQGMTVTVLATQLAEAVAKDETAEGGGIDISAGMYGPNTSDWLREVADAVGMRQATYADSTPHLHIGDSAFEDWFQQQPFACQPGIKQIARDAYAAGMGDPLVIAKSTPLREGQVMGAYMDFDRTADPTWTPAEYLVRFGMFISTKT